MYCIISNKVLGVPHCKMTNGTAYYGRWTMKLPLVNMTIWLKGHNLAWWMGKLVIRPRCNRLRGCRQSWERRRTGRPTVDRPLSPECPVDSNTCTQHVFSWIKISGACLPLWFQKGSSKLETYIYLSARPIVS